MQFTYVFVHPVRKTLYSLAGCYETDARDVGAPRHSDQLKSRAPVHSAQADRTCVPTPSIGQEPLPTVLTVEWRCRWFYSVARVFRPSDTNSYDSHLRHSFWHVAPT